MAWSNNWAALCHHPVVDSLEKRAQGFHECIRNPVRWRRTSRNAIGEISQQRHNLTVTGWGLSLRLTGAQQGLCGRFLVFTAAVLSHSTSLPFHSSSCLCSCRRYLRRPNKAAPLAIKPNSKRQSVVVWKAGSPWKGPLNMKFIPLCC